MTRAPLLFLLLSACVVPTEDVPDECDEAPSVTWQTFGRGFLTTHCQGCHASTAPDRRGAPPGLAFDDEASVAQHRDAILASVTGDTPTMPPNGGPTQDDRDRVALWLLCDPP
ncbi:MAG: hypothetical protein KC731_19740 [Myxococcales bacterium]|nr:hypothetical protein [Myxococcales bacterium]